MELATRGPAANGAVKVSLLSLTPICLKEIAHPQMQSHKRAHGEYRSSLVPQKAGDSWDLRTADASAVLPLHFRVFIEQ